MKKNEFIERVEELGLDVDDWKNKEGLCIEDEHGVIYAFVREDVIGVLDNDCEGLSLMDNENKDTLFNLLVEYASTPIEERKEEKLYYIKHIGVIEGLRYLNYKDFGKEWYLSSKFSHDFVQTVFTLSELPDWVHKMIKQGHLVKEEVE